MTTGTGGTHRARPPPATTGSSGSRTRSDERDTTAVPDLPPPGGLDGHAGRWPRHPALGAGPGRHRLPRAPRPRRRRTAATSTPVDHLGGDVLAVPETWYVDTTGEPGATYDYAVASVPTVTECGDARRRRHQRVAHRRRTRPAGLGGGRRPRRGRAAGPAVAADDRQRAAEPAAVHRPHPAAARSAPSCGPRCGECTTRSASPPSAPTRSCTTTSASTARSTVEPVHDFTPIDRVYDTHPRDRPAPLRRARLHAARPGQ